MDFVASASSTTAASSSSAAATSATAAQAMAALKIDEKRDEAGGDDNDSDDDDDEDDNNAAGGEPSGKKKKKKKKKRSKAAKKAAAAAAGDSDEMPPVNDDFVHKPPLSRLLGGTANYYMKWGQTDPPTIPVQDLFPAGHFPKGQFLPSGETKYPPHFTTTRCSAEEKREKERLLHTSLYEKARCAAECHRQVRSYMQSITQPGVKLVDMCERLEETNRKLVKENGLLAGLGFPTGCSINHVAAHYTPNNGDNTVLQYGDVMKIDFGTQIEGRIIDCAYTVSFDPIFDPLLIAVKEATDAGIRAAGVDMQMRELGAIIEEVMTSHEITLPTTIHRNSTTIHKTVADMCGASTSTTTYPIKCCRNLHGHSIGAYEIHAGKSVPIVASSTDTSRMEEGEFYAIETFGTTGQGWVDEVGECSHYMKNYSYTGPNPAKAIKSVKAKSLYNHISKTFGTLAFCRRWLERVDGGSETINRHNGRQENYLFSLQQLVDARVVNAYPPLVDIPTSHVAQYEHTLLLRPTGKEVLSRGDDY